MTAGSEGKHCACYHPPPDPLSPVLANRRLYVGRGRRVPHSERHALPGIAARSVKSVQSVQWVESVEPIKSVKSVKSAELVASGWSGKTGPLRRIGSIGRIGKTGKNRATRTNGDTSYANVSLVDY